MNNTEKVNIYYKGRIYQPERYLPDFFINESQLQSYISSLKFSYPYIGTNLKDGQVVVEGVDYELQKQICNSSCGRYWTKASQEAYDWTKLEKRIVAIPSEHLSQEKKEEDNIWENVWDLARDRQLHDFNKKMKERYTIQKRKQ